MSAPIPARRFRLGARTFVLVAACALAVCELSLRLVWGFGNPRIVETSARLGYRFYPGQTIAGPRGTTERINAHGYRDEEWDLDSTASCAPVRIVVLGASVSYGTGVEDEAAWPRVLESELAFVPEGGASGFDVYNLALPGYVLDQLANQYEDDVRPLEPEVVILELSPLSVRPAPVRSDGVRYPLHTWIRRSAIYDALRRHADPGAFDPERGRLALLDPEQQVDDEHRRRAQVRLDELAERVRADGARLVLLETPSLGAVLSKRAGPGLWSAWAERRPDVVYLGTTDVLRAEMGELLEDIESRGFGAEQVWTRFGEPLPFAAGTSSVFFRDDPLHLNERGHSVVARAVLAGLREAGLL